MIEYKVVDIVDGMPTFSVPLNQILSNAERGGALRLLTPTEYHTTRQRNWFKGVLLPALANDSGDSKRTWEIKIISHVYPEDVERLKIGDETVITVPSISMYGKKKMSGLIEESVPYCHECGFGWVTYPDEELRRK